MRAVTPNDELQHFGDFVAMPKPKYDIGTRINVARNATSDLDYYFRKIAVEILQDTRKIVDKLKREGYMTGMLGNKMLPGNKAQIRAKLDMVRYADSIELAGSAPQGMHVTGTIGNQCYLVNGQCHSGVDHVYYLLFRRVVDGNKTVYIHPYPVVREIYLRNLVEQPA